MDRRPSLARYRPVALDDLIRIGRPHDGGYVVSARSCARAELLVGLGINTDWSFEADFLARWPDARLLAADGSVSSATFRERALVDAAHAAAAAARLRAGAARAHLARARRHLALARDFGAFFAGARRFVARYVGERDGARAIGWASLVRLGHPAGGPPPATFVKMDIEGAEYRVLPDLLGDVDRLVGLVVEFHDCDLLWERFVATMAALDPHFAIAHVHGNNYAPLIAGTDVPRVLEVSFVHRRLLRPDEGAPSARAYPLPGLDQPNHRRRPDYRLTFASAARAAAG